MYQLFHETSETPGTVGTVLRPKNDQKSIKKGIIRSLFKLK